MLIKISLTVISFICIANVNAQNDTIKPKFISKEYDYKINRDKLIKNYADSVNRIYTINDIPDFLFNECLEYNITLRKGYHSSESVRWEILKKVTNKNALRMVLQSKDGRLKAHCRKYKQDNKLKIDYSDMTFYELVQKRFKSLK